MQQKTGINVCKTGIAVSVEDWTDGQRSGKRIIFTGSLKTGRHIGAPIVTQAEAVGPDEKTAISNFTNLIQNKAAQQTKAGTWTGDVNRYPATFTVKVLAGGVTAGGGIRKAGGRA